VTYAPEFQNFGRRPRQDLISGPYLRNAWYVAAWSDDIGDDALVARTIMDEPIVLYRKAAGGVAAIEDRCAHRFAPLSMGKIVGGDRIQCPYHGLEFDGSGACVKNPHGTKSIPPRARVKSYPIIENIRQCGSGWATDRPIPEKYRTSPCSTMYLSSTPPSATRL
jgi:nitrite reductase/ring-hydroxylating ferredoxin subunit